VERASKRYELFLRTVEDLAGVTALVPRRPYEVFELHWPGDHPSGLRVRNWMSFDARIGRADEAGNHLADVLRAAAARDVVIVAHSLGCRVVLRALQNLHAGPGGSPRMQVVLMAAAVPVEDCATGQFEKQPASATCTVLHSLHDMVLSLAYPPGQALESRFAEAVGRRGLPRDRWSARSHQTQLGHGDYWGSESAARSTLAAMQAAGTVDGSLLPLGRGLSRGPLPAVDPLPRIVMPRRALPMWNDAC
jgi:hypothetical protein